MNRSETANNLKRRLPSVNIVLQEMADVIDLRGHSEVSKVVAITIDGLRQKITLGANPEVSVDGIRAATIEQLEEKNQPSLKPVINLTGTVLHTNLGRAVLPQEALDAVVRVAGAPSNLEFDLAQGGRGERDSHIETLICELTGAEAATVVNNNAAAVLLTLNTLASNREVPVSRGELVEIGGSFRIPEVMLGSGCQLVEIGATNRTHLKDYAAAIGDNTALLLKVHTSNYRIEGFTESVSEIDLAKLAQQHQLPLVADLGSGSLVDFSALGLPHESTAAESIANGVDIITFSGDKLLGGPQCGIIAGRKALIDQINKNPLKRALRLDKMTLAALAEVLKLYRDPLSLTNKLPTLRYLTRPLADMQQQAQRLVPAVRAALPKTFHVGSKTGYSQIGSGALPVETLETIVLSIAPLEVNDSAVRKLSDALRALPCAIIGRIHKGELLLDLRCLDDEDTFLQQLQLLADA
ncbi:L-seryl-tRNA(Sec) selenium transferase [SAR92 clade bacterium H455]|uniref:L-seryl-tRNA(Sec) selenium transferase n=1 Tax=SAR92 clade bacterium H455 TaxID=2974818 RepID=A0ABY5TT46_9GAMM|nr:L-seryl-tRNA(Sec) selenium transferase [SAR92 clade bacterium H455]